MFVPRAVKKKGAVGLPAKGGAETQPASPKSAAPPDGAAAKSSSPKREAAKRARPENESKLSKDEQPEPHVLKNEHTKAAGGFNEWGHALGSFDDTARANKFSRLMGLKGGNGASGGGSSKAALGRNQQAKMLADLESQFETASQGSRFSRTGLG